MSKTMGIGIGLGVLALALFVGALSIANGPDRDIEFTREVPSALPLSVVDTSLRSVLSWPEWHHQTAEAVRHDVLGRAMPMNMQTIERGALVRFVIEPKQQKRLRFELEAEVTNYVPGKLLHLRLLGDSSGRIFEQFNSLEWQIELLPGTPNGAPELGKDRKENGTLIRGHVKASTKNWRARLFGTIAQHIVMNQLLYPNLIALAELKQSRTILSLPQSQQ